MTRKHFGQVIGYVYVLNKNIPENMVYIENNNYLMHNTHAMDCFNRNTFWS